MYDRPCLSVPVPSAQEFLEGLAPQFQQVVEVHQPLEPVHGRLDDVERVAGAKGLPVA